MSIFAGIEIGGTKLQIIYENDNGNIVHRFRANINPEEGAEIILRQIREDILSFTTHTPLTSIGVGFGGPIDRSRGLILQSFQVKGWSGFPIYDWFQSWCPVPIVIENDANVAAFGEAMRGAGKKYSRVFYITNGSGVGSGFVMDKKLYVGAGSVEMEFGHLRIDMSGMELEQKCSGWAINREIRDRIQSDPSSDLARLVSCDPGHEARHLSTALAKGDPTAKQIFSDTLNVFAFALSHVIHLLGPDVIIIGGGLSLIGKPLCDVVTSHLQKHLIDIFRPGPPVMIALLGEDVVPLGAIEYAKQFYKT